MALIEPKPFASLGATLLARKGGARPAMRPQLAIAAQAPQDFVQDLEDLGWNDMGDDDTEERRETVVLSLTPAPHPHHGTGFGEPPDEPEVLRQQRSLADSLERSDFAADFEQAQPERQVARRPAAPGGRRAAFTLRLDVQRHLKLRLASTVTGRSAQALVTQALDEFLAEIPEIDALAAQLKRD
ncbi:MAG: hypothetical protein ABIP41_07560 [Croceibacterium sp.]